MIISRSEILSQTAPALIIPNKTDESIKLYITAIPNFNAEKSYNELLSIYVKNDKDHYCSNAVQGRYKVERTHLTFTPYFPFEGGMTYVARTKYSDTNSSYYYQSFEVGKKQSIDEAKVVRIYPSANELPENLLRFYIYFNTPMKKGQVLKHIKLVDAVGNIDNEAFMEFKQELWSADGKRFTLLFDPGRIKRGVSTNRELGPALLEGNNYQLTISGAMQDVHGQALSVNTTKEFVVVKAYRHLIRDNELEIQKPKVNSDDVLKIHFDRIIDHALVQSMIKVENENKKLINGYWETSREEKIIQFIPENPWKKGTYRIIMDSQMEDIAGNNVNNLLDQKADTKDSNIRHLIRLFTI